MASILNQIKALNERIADVARQFGVDSPLYERYEKTIMRLIPESMRGESRTGYIRIKQDKATQKAMESGLSKSFDRIQDIRTRGQYKAKKREQFVAEYGEGKPTAEQLQEYIDKEKTVRARFESGDWKIKYNEASEDAKDRFRAKGSKSYAELYNMLDQIGAI